MVGGTERCASCGRQLISRAFYIFPCEHGFHNDCLWNEVRPLLTDVKRKLADQIDEVTNIYYTESMFFLCVAVLTNINLHVYPL